jgi:hypothetical protein
MRNLLLALSISAAACGARAPRTTMPPVYACDDTTIVPNGKSLEIREPNATLDAEHTGPATLGWHDGEGDHYVAWPQSPVEVSAVEFVVPFDPHSDPIERRVYDTSSGTSKADWRLIRRQVCSARDGDSEVLARYVTGDSLDKIASDLALGNRDEARELVHHAMLALQRRYFRDR